MTIKQKARLARGAKENGQMYAIAATKVQLGSIMSVAIRIDMSTVSLLVELLSKAINGSQCYESAIIGMLFEGEPIPLCPGLKYLATVPSRLRFCSDEIVDDDTLGKEIQIDESFIVDPEAAPPVHRLVYEASKLFDSVLDLQLA